MTHIIPPRAKKKPKELSIHNDVRIDNYYWLNQRENPEVIDYLNAENEYFDKMTSHTKKLQDDLFSEMKSRIKEDDESVPYKKKGYYYISRYKKGDQYPIHSRRNGNLDAKDEVLFDVNKMAKGFEYFNLKGVSISPNNKLAVFGTDKVSRRQYTLQFKNLETNEIYSDQIENTTGSASWANDNQTVYYAKQDETTLRSDKIYKHVFGTDVSEDVLVYHEKDDTFGTFVYKTKSEKFIIIGCYNTISTEYRFLSADNPEGEFTVFQPRERDLEYGISHFDGHFYILTNKDKATNFKLMKTVEVSTLKENWIEVIPHREDVLLEDVSVFINHLVLEERQNGLNKIRVICWDGTEDYYLPFEEETYSVGVYSNPEFDTSIIRYGYNSMTTPSSVIDFNLDDKSKEIKKEQEVLGGHFKKENYKSERIWATADDGQKIAISLVYHKDTNLSKDTPLLLYAYGSYGHTIEDSFSTTRLSLLDRGFIFAIAHVRGSEYLGREWYEKGKLLHKRNTFTDFINCAEFLISKKYTSPKHLYASGGSAGGLLMGAILNMSPNHFNGIIASVPFVDVVTTMLDESIPLTTGEYDEWGNPNNKEYYNYIKAYSPYDNVENKPMPNLLVTTGLHDSQVQYFEPAKWVAKIREQHANKNKVLLYTDMSVGHGGASGRFDSLKDGAREYAFLIDLECHI
jgi:oligopeptidase B|tara:strand:+ start:93465 stop:95519 length:2055 start_codon:yes stop_codon:yes gene_type:complete